jgi:hypothetical protein
MLSRRKFLLLLLALLSLDFGVSQYRMEPPGWKTERWQAGFGSWCCGGYLVAYDISIPKDYDFTPKCGKAWVVTDDAMIDDFLLQFSFFGTSRSPYDDKDFDDYLKIGAAHSAQSFDRRASDIDVDTARPYSVGALRFSRSDILLSGEAQSSAQERKKLEVYTARGFRLKGSGMSIISESDSPPIDDVNEKIIRSMPPVKGLGLFDAWPARYPDADVGSTSMPSRPWPAPSPSISQADSRGPPRHRACASPR